MIRITASPETLMRQAGMTADVYLRDAIENIEKRLGKGFAAKNPELIAAMIKASSADYAVSAITAVIQDAVEEVMERV